MRVLNKKNYELLRELVIADFKVRYQGSVLGYFWSFLRPLALFSVLYFVFARLLRFGKIVPHFPAYLLLGIVLWTFFIEATNNGLRAIVDKGDMLRKVKVPTYSLVLASTFSAFINLLLNMVVVTILILVTGGSIGLVSLLFFGVAAELFVAAMATSFLLSALYVKYRDIQYIWEVGSQMLFYATPIIYPLVIVPHSFQKIVILNPIAQIIQDARYLMVTRQSTTIWGLLHLPMALIPFGILLAIVLVSIWYFRQQSKFFAENL